MRILLLGAAGFIGRHILAELLHHGHEVVAVVRNIGALADQFPQVNFVGLDLAKATHEADWMPHMAGIDLVINAAGILRGADMTAVQVAMPQALHAAAAQAGVSRIILISAISARADVPTDYAQSKLAGEEALRSSSLGWTILRPSLVYADGSYGGSSLLRGMAGLPGLIPVPGSGDFAFTPIHARDLARSIRVICEDGAFDGQTLEPVGPERLTLRDILLRYRYWLGFGRARFLSILMPVMRFFARIGDVFGDGPIATNSLIQMIAGNDGDSEKFAGQIGFLPRSFDKALQDRPAQVQDRWHARLFFLAPLLRIALILMWLSSAFLGLFYGAELTAELVSALGLPMPLADPLRIGSSVLDIGIAALLVLDRGGRWSLITQIAVVLGYTAVLGLALPHLWLDPLGPLLKNIPVMMTILAYAAIAERR